MLAAKVSFCPSWDTTPCKVTPVYHTGLYLGYNPVQDDRSDFTVSKEAERLIRAVLAVKVWLCPKWRTFPVNFGSFCPSATPCA